MRRITSASQFGSHLIKDEAGVTAVEYGLFAALIAAVIAGVVTTIGTNLTVALSSVVSAL